MKRGFTLIELLAVIIILAVIALITTPVVLNVVNKAKKQADQNSVYGIIDGARLYYAESLLDDTKKESIDGTTNLLSKISISGQVPSNGVLYINTNGQISLSLVYNDICYIKNFDETALTEDSDINNCVPKTLYVEELLNGTDPQLDSEMIPIYFDGNVAKKASLYDEWYSYADKKWANAILVKDDVKSSYKTMSAGTEINTDDVLAYFVWIPRYKYELFNVSGVASSGNEHEINIVFENKDVEKSNGTTDGSFLTAPGFTFGDTELNGIWVGKFETSTDTTSTCYTTASATNCDNANQNPRILPNVYSLRYLSVSNAFTTSQKFTSLLGVNSESKMMTSSEWGAVAYLSHSIYGINGEIRINNNSRYTTGCGASVINGSSTTTCELVFGSASEYPQSTTGNITGIFDMSGGANEYVMANLGDIYGNMIVQNSGFTDIPLNKYYDAYKTSCSGSICLGRAITETNNWYSDSNTFPYTGSTWVYRGGYYGSGSSAGIFNYYRRGGDGEVYESFRIVSIVD